MNKGDKSNAIVNIIIDNVDKMTWKITEKELRKETLVKVYISKYKESVIIFEDNYGTLTVDDINIKITIELTKKQYKTLNTKIIQRINENEETILDELYEKLKGDTND